MQIGKQAKDENTSKYFVKNNTLDNAVFDKLAIAIAEALGWTFVDHQVTNNYYDCHRTIVSPTSKYALNIELDARQKNKQNPKIEISWSWQEMMKNYYNPEQKHLINYVSREKRYELKINLSANRDPQKIAKDILRRLFTPTQQIVDDAIKYFLISINFDLQSNNISNKLTESINGTIHHSNSNQFYKYLSSKKAIKILAIDGKVHGKSINLAFNNLSLSVAKQVIEFVKNNCE